MLGQADAVTGRSGSALMSLSCQGSTHDPIPSPMAMLRSPSGLRTIPFQLIPFSGTFRPCLARLFASRQDVYFGRCAFATRRRSRLDRIQQAGAIRSGDDEAVEAVEMNGGVRAVGAQRQRSAANLGEDDLGLREGRGRVSLAR